MGQRKFVKKILKYGCDNLNCGPKCPFYTGFRLVHTKEQAKAWAKQWLEEHPNMFAANADGMKCMSIRKNNEN